MTEEKLPPIREVITIHAPIGDVWRIMTEEETVPTWLGCMRYRRAIGHIFFMQQDPAKRAADDVSGATHCEILALDAPGLFKFSWFLPGFPATYVSFTLSPLGQGLTQLEFMHEGWDKFPADQIRPIRDMLDGGWRSFIVPGLKKAAEKV